MNASVARRAGLVILGLLSLGDLATPLMTDGEHPPYAVAALAALLGAVSLVLVVRAYQDPSRSLRLLIGLRVLSAVAAVPAFLESGVPAAAQVVATVLIALTATGVLLTARGRTQVVAS